MLKEGWRGKHFFLLRWVRSEGHDADEFAFTNTNFLRTTICWVNNTNWYGKRRMEMRGTCGVCQRGDR